MAFKFFCDRCGAEMPCPQASRLLNPTINKMSYSSSYVTHDGYCIEVFVKKTFAPAAGISISPPSLPDISGLCQSCTVIAIDAASTKRGEV